MMKATVKFIGAIVVALVVMLVFRSLVMTVCTVDGKGLEPVFQEGDRVVVNRWSYGLRTGRRGSLFGYDRICRQPVEKGDFVAFEDSLGQVLICRCAGVPGDTIFNQNNHGDRHHDLRDATITVPVPMIVPGIVNCARQDYYWVESLGKNNATDSRQLGFIPEERIIGRACLILYNHDPEAAFWKGYMKDRVLLLP